ncbi:hypothetical protein EBR21_05895 [bacterium]|nr:hypothetical protein [bacterium]
MSSGSFGPEIIVKIAVFVKSRSKQSTSCRAQFLSFLSEFFICVKDFQTFSEQRRQSVCPPARARKATSRKTKVENEANVDCEPAELNSNRAPHQDVQQTAVSNMVADDFQEESTGMTQQQNPQQTWDDGTVANMQQVNEVYPDSEGGAEFAGEAAYYEDENYSESGEQYGQNQNQILLTLSYSLMNHVRQVARMEGVFPEDILVELIAEGVTRRAFEDAQRPAPSHLMTRTGYVAPDANGNVHQPQLSHHGMQGNQRGNHQGNNNRRFHQNNNRGNHFQGQGQGRNRQNQFKNKQRNGK